MAIPKRHHVISRFILRNFTDDSGKLFIFDKARRDLGIRALSPDNAFVRGHYFSEKDKSGNVDPTPETRLGQVESTAAPAIKKIIEAVRSGASLKLSLEDRRSFLRFVYFQMKRSPEWFRKISEGYQNKETLEAFLREFEQKRRPLTEAERKDFSDPKTLKRLNENVRARVMSSESDLTQAILSMLGKKGLHFVRLPPNKSLIIGTNSIVRYFASGKPHLTENTTHMCVPISYDVAAILRGDQFDTQIYGPLDKMSVRSINLMILDQSDLVASRNAALLNSLISNR